jgi:hypothetical protein
MYGGASVSTTPKKRRSVIGAIVAASVVLADVLFFTAGPAAGFWL